MKRFLVIALAVILPCVAANKVSADLIITEFMADPSALDDSVGEYFELYNSGLLDIDVSTLTISDDGSNSVDLASAAAGVILGSGEFLVLGRAVPPPGSGVPPYADVIYGNGFVLANGEDEIVVSITGGAELARLNYTDGNPFGPGTAAVLNNTGNAVGGVTQESDYIAEVIANDTLPTFDIGSPGVAGSTMASVVPEPTSAIVLGMGSVLLLARRRR